MYAVYRWYHLTLRTIESEYSAPIISKRVKVLSGRAKIGPISMNSHTSLVWKINVRTIHVFRILL